MSRIWMVLLLSLSGSLFAIDNPSGNLYLDELGDASYTYLLDDQVSGNDDGKAYETDSTGNNGGAVCSALDFTADSTDDYATMDEKAVDGANDFTISVWIKSNSTKNSQALLSGARSRQANALLLWFQKPTLFQPHIDNQKKDFTIPNLYDGQWHHFVFRRQGSTGCVIIDKDTANKVCHTVSTATIRVESWLIGQEQDSVGGGFNIGQDWEGYVDEVVSFKSALPDADIEAIYDNQKSGKNYDGSDRTCQTAPPPQPGVDYDYADYHFDELGYHDGGSDEVKDSHWGKDGTPYDVQTVPGKLCQAVDLTKSSTSDYVKFPPEVLDGTSDFTIAVWQKGKSGVDSNALLSAANRSQDNEILYWFQNSTTFRGHLKNDQLNITSPDINDDTWHHLVWRLKGKTSCYFFDGVKKGCVDYAHSYTFTVEGLILGQDQDRVEGGFNAAQDWEGLVDELLIFRRALSDSEIQDGYNNQNNGKNWDGTDRVCPYPSITKTSCVINDPVNADTNPKRIPGAMIRYAIEVSNPNSSTLEDAKVEDNLTSELDTSNSAPKVVSGGCDDCVNLTGGDAGNSGVNGNTITIDFGNVSGGTLSNPTKECGYFEVEIR